jgi:hypothetical protein
MSVCRRSFRAIAIGALASVFFAPSAGADTGAFTIVDDPALDAAVAQARSVFLTRAPFDRLDCTILVEQPGGTWRRGSYNPTAIAYPASCVKLPYLAAAIRWSADNGFDYDHLDASLRPMITVSSNVATGEVVDAITGAPNLQQVNSPAHPQWAAWYDARLFTEDYLGQRGLLGNQTIVNKTYPTNSGSSPSGAEGVMIDVRGGNRMQPLLSASLMLEVVGGAIETDTGLAGSTAYMRDLLTHERFSDYSSIGFGLPPGSLYENKIGLAYDTLEDIAHVRLPNGTRMIIAVYSNGWDQTQPLPYDAAPLGVFADELIIAAGLDAGNPPRLVSDDNDAGVTYTGSWAAGSAQPDKYATTYRYASGGAGANTAEFDLDVPEGGRYEVLAWWPAATNRATNTPFTVTDRDGEQTTVRLDQTVWGGRWVRLGDFAFETGGGRVVVADDGTGAGLVLVDAIKAVKHPCTADLTTTGRGRRRPRLRRARRADHRRRHQLLRQRLGRRRSRRSPTSPPRAQAPPTRASAFPTGSSPAQTSTSTSTSGSPAARSRLTDNRSILATRAVVRGRQCAMRRWRSIEPGRATILLVSHQGG